MPKINAFTGYLINPKHAEEVVSPAYDSVSPEERRKFAESNPRNFLNTMRLLDDFPQDKKPAYDELLASNKSNLDMLLSNGSFDRFDKSCLFIYQISNHDHQQTGIICEVPVSEYEQGLMRKHENTRSDKEDLLAQYQEVVGAASSPICLAYPQDNRIDKLVEKLTQAIPVLHFSTKDFIEQKVWIIENEDDQIMIGDYFADIAYTYLTDGHHRAASGRRYADIMRPQHGNTGTEPYNQLLVALFPGNQLNLLPYHRCIKDLNGRSESELIDDLSQYFDVEKILNCTYYQPIQPREFGICIKDNWYRLNIYSQYVDTTEPVASLDVVILQNYILGPVLGIKDVRHDSRLDYIAGTSDLEKVITQKKSEGWQIILTCHATAIEQMMRVADAHQLMPPKSTYFDPKPKPGIFVSMK